MIWAAVQGVSAIAGMWSSARGRSKENEKRNLAKGVIQGSGDRLATDYTALQSEYGADVIYEQNQRVAGMNTMVNTGRQELQNINQQYGLTGIQSGAGQQMQDTYNTNLGNQFNEFNEKMNYASILKQRQFASDKRGIAAAGFDIDRYAADKNIKSSIGQTLLDSMNGGYNNG